MHQRPALGEKALEARPTVSGYRVDLQTIEWESHAPARTVLEGSMRLDALPASPRSSRVLNPCARGQPADMSVCQTAKGLPCGSMSCANQPMPGTGLFSTITDAPSAFAFPTNSSTDSTLT